VCVLHRQCYYFVCLNDKIGPHIFVYCLFMYLFIFYFLVAVCSYDTTNFNENWLRFIIVCFMVYVTLFLQLGRLCNVKWDEDVLWSILSGIADEIKIYYAIWIAGFKADSWNHFLLNMKFAYSPLICVYSCIQVQETNIVLVFGSQCWLMYNGMVYNVCSNWLSSHFSNSLLVVLYEYH